MNLAAVALLRQRPETRTWYRAAGTRWVRSAIATAHTRVTRSRFYDPYSATPQFPSLYLTDSPLVAMFEAHALFGSSTMPGGPVPAPRGGWVILTVRVQLQAVLDLSDLASQAALDVSAQELTGDWQGYWLRSPASNVAAPTGAAPTQMLGEAIHRDARRLEGFTTVSAKVPTNRNLIVFPDHIRAGNFVSYEWEDENGSHIYRIDQDNTDGRVIS
jgi:hypothetical protein